MKQSLILFLLVSCHGLAVAKKNPYETLEQQVSDSLTQLCEAWYPNSVDAQYGGFLTQLDREWSPVGNQNKFIIHQARHLWTTSKLAIRFPEKTQYLEFASSGYEFMREHFQKQEGGFYWSVDRSGKAVFVDERTANSLETYAHAFIIYGLVGYFEASGDTESLLLAQEVFEWLETELHDDAYGGYYNSQFLKKEAEDGSDPLFVKGQNTSIHLMEAFGSLYRVWKSPLLAERLQELVALISRKMQDSRGFTKMFFSRDWSQQTLLTHKRAKLLGYHHIENVSFGHDVEIAYLLLDAIESLGNQSEREVLKLGRIIVDHALEFGWDAKHSGLFNSGRYLDGKCIVLEPGKTWWVQAENLNTMVLLSQKIPEMKDRYMDLAQLQWEFIQSYQIDAEFGGWYEEIIGVEVNQHRLLKSHRWKGSYHDLRALLNVSNMLATEQ